jgi:putative nucleotidyltransferase with HDIG domain
VAVRTKTFNERRWAIARSVTLLHVFLLASAVILLVGALILTSVLTATVRTQAIESQRSSLTRYVDGVLRPQLVHGDRIAVGVKGSAGILRSLQLESDVVSVKVWRADGVLAWTNRDPARIGHRFKLDSELGAVIHKNETVGSITSLSTEGEAGVEARLGFSRLLQVYAPIRSPEGTDALGAYEIYADPAPIERLIASRKHVVWVAVGLVFLVLYAALALLVRGASRTLHRQTKALYERSQELLDAYRLLEQNTLEAVESLNATVDAKDPYTAGHSQRVERIAVALGEQLGLPDDRITALHFGGLFHDIGKLAVPDTILWKPAPLSTEEYEVIKRHPADGARILERFSHLREAVPLIRHHHEWWDGTGYPDRLAGEEIPFEARIVGLADAWDSMTTPRVYHRALTLVEAEAQIREGRGTQFAPEVVDAFFAALQVRPADFGAGDIAAVAS